MKKLIVVALLVCPGILFAQSRIKSNHSASLKINGLEYAYEQALGGDFSLVGHTGIEANFWWGYSSVFGNGQGYTVNPVLSLEPRYYYNINRRLGLDKNISGVSANFISLEAKYIFAPIASDNMDVEYPFMISPTWGLRRVWRDHWLLEFNTGINFYRNNNESAWGPRVNLKFGFKF